MEKRYQVFVSSTYADLTEERAEVMQALLELDCMPAGMELFPAANEEQWNWIKKVIDESDYYIVIVGGRYGSVSKKTGQSYTEMEYRYAREIGKSVIGFLHEDPTKIESGKSEKSEELQEKLESFREFVGERLCKYWSSPADLGAKVSRSLIQLIKHNPSVGWIRANTVPEEISRDILRLRKKIEELEEKLKRARYERPEGTERFAQGDDSFIIEFSFEAKIPKVGKNNQIYWKKGERNNYKVETTWDEIFGYIGPSLLEPCGEHWVIHTLNDFLMVKSEEDLESKYPENKIDEIKISWHSFQTIKIQLRVLNYISIVDEGEWLIAPYGDNRLINMFAVKKA